MLNKRVYVFHDMLVLDYNVAKPTLHIDSYNYKKKNFRVHGESMGLHVLWALLCFYLSKTNLD